MTFSKTVRKLRVGSAGDDSRVTDFGTDPEVLATSFVRVKQDPEVGVISWPRASSLFDACMRMHVIGTKEVVERTRYMTFRDRILFGIGNGLHEYAQNTGWIFGSNRVGWWRCRACGKILYFGTPPTMRCSHCGANKKAISYYEHPFRMKNPVMVTGHVDMFLRRRGLIRVAEIKTIAKEQFEKLKAPLVQHEYQVQTYMMLAGTDKRIPVEVDDSEGYIVYISKGYSQKHFPLKVFAVRKSTEIRKRVLRKLQEFKDGFDGYPEKLPSPDERCVDSDWGGYFSKSCPVRRKCMDFVSVDDVGG